MQPLPSPIHCSPLPNIDSSSTDAAMLSRPASPSPPADACQADAISNSAGPSASGNVTFVVGKDRKQNSACDACRIRKVKCVRTEDDVSCSFCTSKNVECTRYYMALATEASLKKAGGIKKRKRQPTNPIPPEMAMTDAQPSPTTSNPRLRTRTSTYDLTEGALVQVRAYEKGTQWEPIPHRVRRIIYRPVAVVLDSDDALPIAIDHVRPYEPGDSTPSTPGLLGEVFPYPTVPSAASASAPSTPLAMSPVTPHFSNFHPGIPHSRSFSSLHEYHEPNYVAYHHQVSASPMMYGSPHLGNGYFSTSPTYTPPSTQTPAFIPSEDLSATMGIWRTEIQPASAMPATTKPETYV